MRIAVIGSPEAPVPPAATGSVSIAADALCRALAGAGHDVFLWAPPGSTCPVERPSASVLRDALPADRGLEERMSVRAHAAFARAGYYAAREWGADIIHFQDTSGALSVGSTRIAGGFLTLHAPLEGGYLVSLRRAARRLRLIAVSHSQALSAPDLPVAGAVHHGVDVQRVPVGSGRGGYALFLGRIAATKGVHTAIQVSRRAGTKLVIAGPVRPVETDYFETVVRPELCGGVEYIGEASAEAKFDLLGEATCLINPIVWSEPFGLVMIEALATGTPIVATRRGSVPEVVDHGTTGWIGESIDDLAAAVGESHKLDRQACRLAAEERFSLPALARGHTALYEAALE